MNLRDSLPILAVVLVLVGAVVLINPGGVFGRAEPPPPRAFLRATQDVDTYAILTADMIEECQGSAEGMKCNPAKLDENRVYITRRAIIQGEELDRDAYTAVGGDDGWRPGRMDLEVISFRAEIDKILGGTLRPGHKINIYGFHTDNEEHGPAPVTLIADHVWVVDARTSTGREVEARPAEEGDGAGDGLFGSGGLAQASSGPAIIVHVAVEPAISWQIVEALGAQQYLAWVTLAGPSPEPPVTEEPTPMVTTPGPTSTPTPGLMSDLVVMDITTDPSPMVEDQPGTVQVEVKNQGSAGTVTTCWVGLYIDRVAEADPDKKMFCPPLSVGETVVISYTVTLADVGYHSVTAWVDWLEAIPEEDETNNQHSARILCELMPTPTPVRTPTPTVTPTPPTVSLKATPTPTPTSTVDEPVIRLILQNTPYRWQLDVEFDDSVSPVSAVSAEEIRGAGQAYGRDFHTRELELTVKNVYPPGDDVWIVRTNNEDERAEVLIEGHAKDEEGRDLFRPGEDGTIVIRLVEGATEATVKLLDGVAEAEGAGSALTWWGRPIANR
ncbi:MAG: hypothetical protein ISS50_07245 [Anaerolineae bacterium]|nr:hypothetical protein [Anaerolineae bacterium]